jgi:pSer/pThr/pTyr-binding forkhead associated (FHA) protein
MRPEEDLPPPSLARLHFQRIGWAAVPVHVPAPDRTFAPPAPPAPRPAAKPPSTQPMPRPALQPRDPDADARGVSRTHTVGQTTSDLATGAQIRSAKPRLILFQQGFRRIVRITHAPFRIGRAVDADCTLDSQQVSNAHARILVAGDGTFQIEDLHSTNGTFTHATALGQPLRHQLPPGTVRELRGMTRVWFAGVEALFVTDREREELERAVSRAQRMRLVEAAALSGLQPEAERLGVHVAEVAVRDGVLGVEPLLELLEETRVFHSARAMASHSRLQWWIALLVVLGLVAAAYVAFCLL